MENIIGANVIAISLIIDFKYFYPNIFTEFTPPFGSLSFYLSSFRINYLANMDYRRHNESIPNTSSTCIIKRVSIRAIAITSTS